MAVAYANPPDLPEWAVWRRFLREGDTFVDVGANVGVYSILACEAGASVLAIEPSVDTVAELNRNLSLNGLLGRVSVHQLVLADKPGLVRFTAGLDSVNRLDAGGTEEVEATTLDWLLDGRKIAGMKVDTEGAERLVLEGGIQSLADGRIGLLQLEMNSMSQQTLGEDRGPVVRLLRNADYCLAEPIGTTGRLRIVDAPGDGEVFAARRDTLKQHGLLETPPTQVSGVDVG